MRSDSKVFVKPDELFKVLDRQVDSQRVLLSGLEAIVYGHPYKKFYFSLAQETWTYLQNKDRVSGFKIDVVDYGVRVGSVSTYSPDGMERNKLQVQFQYDYNVHQKEPRNVKRSSDHKKISEFAKLFRSIDLNAERTKNGMFEGVISDIADVTKLRDGNRPLKSLMEQFYYGSAVEKAKIVRDLVDGVASPATEKFKQEFEAAWAKANSVGEEHARLTSRIATIMPTPYGEFAVARFQYKGRGSRDDVESFASSMTMYPDRESLPEDISGRMSVLEIANTSDESIVSVDGVGIFHKHINKMVIIGEDLNGIDTGAEGQAPSSQSS